MEKKKVLLFSLTKKDFEIENITCRGAGGQNINRRHNGVRIRHKESSSTAECCQYRETERNKEEAFKSLIKSNKFQSWHKLETARRLLNYQTIEQMIESIIDKNMDKRNLKLEVKDEKGRWIEIIWDDLEDFQNANRS